MYFTYILKSTISGRYYYGHTQNLEQRLKQHNSGKTRSTKAYKPWEVHYHETFETKSEAYRREMFFKSIDGRIYLKSENIIWKQSGRIH